MCSNVNFIRDQSIKANGTVQGVFSGMKQFQHHGIAFNITASAKPMRNHARQRLSSVLPASGTFRRLRYRSGVSDASQTLKIVALLQLFHIHQKNIFTTY